MRRFIDLATTTSITSETSNQLLWLAGAIVGIVLVQQFITVFVTHVGETVAWTATNALRLDLMDHCLHLDMAFHNEHTPGEMIERIDGDVEKLAEYFSSLIIQLFGNAEIDQLDHAVLRNQDITRRYIAMQNPVFMQILDPASTNPNIERSASSGNVVAFTSWPSVSPSTYSITIDSSSLCHT